MSTLNVNETTGFGSSVVSPSEIGNRRKGIEIGVLSYFLFFFTCLRLFACYTFCFFVVANFRNLICRNIGGSESFH